MAKFIHLLSIHSALLRSLLKQKNKCVWSSRRLAFKTWNTSLQKSQCLDTSLDKCRSFFYAKWHKLSFHQYVYGQFFEMETDHKPFVSIRSKALNDWHENPTDAHQTSEILHQNDLHFMLCIKYMFMHEKCRYTSIGWHDHNFILFLKREQSKNEKQVRWIEHWQSLGYTERLAKNLSDCPRQIQVTGPEELNLMYWMTLSTKETYLSSSINAQRNAAEDLQGAFRRDVCSLNHATGTWMQQGCVKRELYGLVFKSNNLKTLGLWRTQNLSPHGLSVDYNYNLL